jgi:ribosomal protein S16
MGMLLLLLIAKILFLMIFRPPPDIIPVDDLGPYEIRLQNIGCKNRRFDRIVVQRMKHSPNANEIVENLGSYDPMPNNNNEILVALNLKRLRYWIGTEGVVINPWVQKLLGKKIFHCIQI